MDENNENLGEFSVKQLKNNLKATLQKSGVLGTVKAQIRQEFINSLSAKTHNKASNIDISDRILYSAVFQFLNDRKMVNSISVFLAETGLDPKNTLLSPNDLISMIKFNDLHKVLESLCNNPSGSTVEGINLPPNMVKQKRFTILDLIMHFCTTITENNKEISTQTESAGPSAREALEESLHELRKSFLAGHKGREQTNTTIQERMIAYQRDCEKRVQNDVAMQVSHMRETEITRVRLEEASKARIEIDSMRKRLELDYARRLQALVDSEASMTRRISDQEQTAQRSLYDARQIMQREIDDLRSRESAASRKMDLEAQGVKMLELRLKESLSAIEVREADILRRERTMEEKRSTDTENARKEALARVQCELDMLSRERATLLLERASFLDQQAAQTALVETAKQVREQLKSTKDELSQKEEELQAYQRQHQRIELQRQKEEEEIRKMVAQVDPNYANFSRAEQVVALIRQNAALEVKLVAYSDAHTLQQRLEEKQQECVTAQTEVLELRSLLESERKRTMQDQDVAQRIVASERAKAAACTHKLEELRQLLRDKTQAMETMRGQLFRAEARSSSMGEEGRGASSSSGGMNIPRTSRSNASNTERRAVEFLRRSGHFAEEGATESRKVEQLSSAFLDSVLQRLSAMPPAATGSPYMTYPQYAQMPPAAPVYTAPNLTTATQPHEKQHAQQHAALEKQRRAAEEMAVTLQQEQLRAAELTAQVEQQKLASARLTLQMERSRLEAAEAERQAASLRQPNVSIAPNTYERPPSGKSSATGSTAGVSTSWMSVDAVRLQPGSSASSISSSGRSEARVGDSSSRRDAGSTVGFESDSDAGSRPEPTDGKFTYKKPPSLSERSESEYSFDSDSAIDSQPEPTDGKFTYQQQQPSTHTAISSKVDTTVRSSFDEVSSDEESQPESTDGKFTYSPSSKATSKSASAWDFESDTENESQREPTDGKFTYQSSVTTSEQNSTKETETDHVDNRKERVAEAARLADQEKEEKERQFAVEKQEKLRIEEQKAQELAEKDEEEKRRQQRLKQEREEQQAEETRLRIIQEKEEEEKEGKRIQVEKERLRKEQEDNERKEREQREEQERLEQAERERIESERREAEEAVAEETEAAKKAAAEEEEQRRQKAADEAEIEEARARVLARRRERQRLDGGLVSSSLPTSLQAAAAGAVSSSSTVDGDSRADSAASYSATSALAGMQGGVSTSLDSAVGMRPQRNLFGNNPSFQSLQDSDSSSEGRLEVGDVSDDQEADRSAW